eukprot:4874541-Pyramimonas_sp.AAC.1
MALTKPVKKFTLDKSFRVPRVIKIGADFAGYGAAFIAAKRLGLNCVSSFVCESNRYCQKVLRHSGHSTIIEDATDRDPTQMPAVDIFTFSP